MKIFFYILLLILANIIQISFLNHFDFLKNINLILIIVILTTITNYPLALIGAIAGGFLLDIYSNFWFGSAIISLVLSVIIIKNIFDIYFSKYHLFTYPAIGFISVLSYNLIIVILNSFFYWVGINKIIFVLNKFYWICLVEQIILNIIFIILFYLFAILISANLKKSFYYEK